MSKKLHVLDHSLADHAIKTLRDKDASPEQFRSAILRLTMLLTVQATQRLPLRNQTVETPLTEAKAKVLDCRVGIVPILRAGLCMVDPLLHLLPEAEVWHLGFYRDEQTLEPITYYQKLPPNAPVDVAYVLDPMLATGGSACAALDVVKNWGVTDISFLGMLAAPEGIQAVQEQHPDVPLYLACVDDYLNQQGYIVPGLGDAGDRAFNAAAR